MIIKEEWRPVVGFEGLYEVSNTGQVRNIKGKLLKPWNNCDGYLQVSLYCNGKRHQMSIHRLVSDTFISNPEGLPMINHKDEVKTNNNVDNLEWCTAKYNSNYGHTQEKRVKTNIVNGRYKYIGMSNKEYNKEYYENNKEKKKEYQREYMRKYREKIRNK